MLEKEKLFHSEKEVEQILEYFGQMAELYFQMKEQQQLKQDNNTPKNRRA
ncbi:MAG: hypothetical protein RIC95_09575 [Vicingaceae bacterium]